MSLGYARDSIANIQKLNEAFKDDDELLLTPPASRGNYSYNDGYGDDGEDDFIFYDEDNDCDVNTNGNSNSDNTSTNTRDTVNTLATEATTPVTITSSEGSSVIKRIPSKFDVISEPLHIPPIEQYNYNSSESTSSGTASATANSATGKAKQRLPTPSSLAKNNENNNGETGTIQKDTATTINFKKNKSKSTSSKTPKITAQATTNTKNGSYYYSGFDYSNYESEYNFNAYIDPYGPNNLNHEKGGGMNRNIFCCFFPEKSVASTDDDSSSSDSSTEAGEVRGAGDEGEEEKIDIKIDDDSDISIDVSRHGLDVDLSLSGSASFEEFSPTGKVQNDSENDTVTPNAIGNQDTVKKVDNYDNDPKFKKPLSTNNDQTLDKTNENATETRKREEPGETGTAATKAPVTTAVRKSTPSTYKHIAPLKGILKHTVTKPESAEKNISSPSSTSQNMSNRDDTNNNGETKRRNILPSYELSSTSKDENDTGNNLMGDNVNQQQQKQQSNQRVSFSPMARVVSVTARSDMSFFSRSLIWWQKNDYDDFKKTGRIIAKAMLCGGSEIWLQTSNAWGKKQGQSNAGGVVDNNVNINRTDGNNNDKDQQHMDALKKYGVRDNDLNDEEKDEDMGSKWWCKFGHSRRGLEHIVSIEEGRQRQRFVNIAIQAVLDEQRRQRVTRRDPNKIAAVSLQYTSWARDLAAAAGSADAEAVRSNFNSKAKCRIHHLSKSLNSRSNGVGSPIGSLQVPSATFILSANSALTAKVLDANAHSSFRVKRIDQDNRLDEEKRSTPVNVIAKKAAGFQF